jgi:putative Mg2+ transporter-C (MgtC) family protein
MVFHLCAKCEYDAPTPPLPDTRGMRCSMSRETDIRYRIHPVLPEVIPVASSYELNLTCRSSDEVRLRTLLLSTISQSPATLQAIHSEGVANSDCVRIRAELSTPGRKNEVLEQIVARLSLEPSVSAVSWSIVPAILE